jgi:hypothetical protein
MYIYIYVSVTLHPTVGQSVCLGRERVFNFVEIKFLPRTQHHIINQRDLTGLLCASEQYRPRGLHFSTKLVEIFAG